jgi:uncharacterized protein YcbK (DUF882 family)
MISQYFARHEFSCKCGCGFDTVDVELTALCDEVRVLEDGPVIINSGCRCPSHNAAVGGSDGSMHKWGRAADLRVSDPVKTYDYLCKHYPDRFGFGLYDTFVHVDTRSQYPARWDNRSKV